MSSFTAEKKQMSSLVKSLPFNVKVTDPKVIAILKYHPEWRDDVDVVKRFSRFGGYKLQNSRGFTMSIEAALNVKWGRVKSRSEPLCESMVLQTLAEYV
jgi:hypothetical protein